MCLFSRNRKPFVAKRDYIVYKYLCKKDATYFTPCQHTEVKINDSIKADSNTIYENDYCSYKISVGSGFVHAMLCKEYYFDATCEAYKAIIKKGTEFYIGDGLCDICAREIFITDEIVTEFPSLYEVMKPIIEDFIDDIFDTEEKGSGSYCLANGTYVSPKAVFKKTANLNDEVIGIVNFIKDNTTNVVGLEEKNLTWCTMGRNKTDIVTENPIINYHSTGNDYNGKKHTKDVVSHTTYSEENYPLFHWCVNYVTKGTNKGDWYIGGCGEVKELIRYNMFKVNVALLILQSIQDNVDLIHIMNWMWSSAEHNHNFVWSLHPETGVIICFNKRSQHTVRPFITF